MMIDSLSLVTGPTDEPVSLDEMKDHLRVDDTNSDAYILQAVIAARTHLERTYGRLFMPQTWDYQIDRFPSEIRIPRAPIASITSITYTDTDGASQTLSAASYQTDLLHEPTRIMPAYSTRWPSTRIVYNAVTVRFVGGYSSVNTIPQNLKHAVMMLVAHWFENREVVVIGGAVNAIPFTVSALMAPYETWPIY